MNDLIFDVLVLATIIVVLVLSLLEVIKKAVRIKKEYIPMLGFGIGIIIGAIVYPFTDLDLTYRIWAGAIGGLSATGVFEIGKFKDVIKGEKENG